MRPCYAITSSHLELLQERKRLSRVRSRVMHLALQLSARSYLIVRTLLQLCSVREEVASFLKHIKTKRKRAVCSLLLIVASCFLSHWLNGNYCWLPIQQQSPGSLRVPWPCSIQRGETGAVKTHTSPPCSRGECSSSCCPTGPSLHTPANQLHLISGRNWPPSGCRPPFSHLCYLVHLWSPV